MKIERIEKPAFAVIGKEGSTAEGPGFIQRLWADANGHFDQVQHLAKRDENGALVGIWGAMTGFSRDFQPWAENFSQGLYLAGVECDGAAEAPDGWTKWTVPGFAYLAAACDGGDTFSDMMGYLREHDIPLAGAVQDFTCPLTGKSYMLFPVKRLQIASELRLE